MKSKHWLLILMFTFCFVTGVTAEDQRVRLTIPPEQIPDPAWRREFFEGTLPLKNRPQIISRKKVQDEIHVVVKNTGQHNPGLSFCRTGLHSDIPGGIQTGALAKSKLGGLVWYGEG